MNEIEKLYKNANVEDKNINNQLYRDLNYPQFTAEKQLELIKFLSEKCDLIISHFDKWEIVHYTGGDEPFSAQHKKFKECLAKVLNYFWQDLTKEEKEQVKGILNE